MSLAVLMNAIGYAAEKHSSHRRKDAQKSPYINHPLRTVQLLTSHGVEDMVTLQAAAMHDVLEDVPKTRAQLQVLREEMAELHGELATRVVEEVTDDKELPAEERKRLQLEHAPHLSLRAKRVKLADKAANIESVLRTPPEWSEERLDAYVEWAKAVVDAGLRGVLPSLEAYFDDLYQQYVATKRAN